MNSDTASNSGRKAHRSSNNDDHGDGSMLSKLEHSAHHDSPSKSSYHHADRTAESRVAGNEYGGVSHAIDGVD
ncbi:hypothetical protein BGZ94_005550 [Podila epigama]|nr:hypothetical protein BGZ94_005550 [Podila epigama]